MPPRVAPALAVVAALIAPAAWAQAVTTPANGEPEYGAYLSAECVTCHSAHGADTGVPAITLWPEEDFVAAMLAYKRGLRQHPVMQMVAGRLGDAEIAALAAYFGARAAPD